MRVALYTRVSTADQKPELQLDELRAYAERQQWEVAETYQDVISGAKAQRPGLDRLMEDARLRRFDCVCVWKLDRFGRSLVDCLNNLQALERYRVRFIAVTQGLDTDHGNPVSRFMLQVLGAAAEFERANLDCRAKPSRAGPLPPRLRGRKGRQDGPQPIGEGSAAAPSPQDLRP